MGLDDLDSAKLSGPAVFLGIIVVPILYVDVCGIKTQNNSVLVQKEKSSRFEHQEGKVLWVSFSTKSRLCFALRE